MLRIKAVAWILNRGGGTLINYLTYAPSPPPSDGLAADRQARGPSAEARSPPSPLP